MSGRFVRFAFATMFTAAAAGAQPDTRWPQHSMERPRPPVVDPGPGSLPVPPPKDAIVLFDGKDLSKWAQGDGKAAAWIVRDGYFEVRPGSGALETRDSFGDAQLHIEWMSPNPPRGTGQDRGNSGVFLMNRYELQVLDSYGNTTYADGQAGAMYGQFPPLVNASRPPGAWQSYDIIFHGPRFDASGRLVRPATVTAMHNGILVQDHVTLSGPVGHYARPPYEIHPEKQPLSLQDHGHPVRFRNIWIRDLHGERQQGLHGYGGTRSTRIALINTDLSRRYRAPRAFDRETTTCTVRPVSPAPTALTGVISVIRVLPYREIVLNHDEVAEPISLITS